MTTKKVPFALSMAVLLWVLLAFFGRSGFSEGWTEHSDSGAFEVAHPQGWTVVQDELGRVTLAGPAGETAVVWPF